MTPGFRVVARSVPEPVAAFVRLLTSAGLLAGLRAASAAANFAALALLARLLGTEEYGRYVFWLTIAGMSTTVLTLGLPQLLTREVAAARGAGSNEGIARIVSFVVVVFAVVATALTIVIAGALLGSLFPGMLRNPVPLIFVGLLVVAGQVATVAGGLLTGYEKVLEAQLGALVSPLTLASIAGMTLWIMGAGAHAEFGLSIYLMAATAGAIASWLILRRSLRIERAWFRRPAHVWPARSWLFAGLLFAANQLLVNGITQLDILMLGALSTSSELAQYHVASRFAYLVNFMYASIGAMAAPRLARLHAAGDHCALQLELTRIARAGFLASSAGAAILLLFVGPLVATFGTGFDGAKEIVPVLLGGWVVMAVFGYGHLLLTMTGRVRWAVQLLLVATLLNLVLNALWIPSFGAMGASWASAVSVVGLGVGCAIVAIARYRMRTTVLARG